MAERAYSVTPVRPSVSVRWGLPCPLDTFPVKCSVVFHLFYLFIYLFIYLFFFFLVFVFVFVFVF